MAAPVRVVLFDFDALRVGSDGRALAAARSALEGTKALRGAGGRALIVALLGAGGRAELLERLELAGLQPLFEPVARRLSTSDKAGASWPGRAAFEAALRRLRSNAALSECLLVTAQTARAAAARRLGAQALLAPSKGDDATGDFDDWRELPACIAGRIEPAREDNVLIAARVLLAPRGVEVDAVEPAKPTGTWRLSGQAWRPIPHTGAKAEGPLHAAVPVRGTLRLAEGSPPKVQMAEPDAAQLQEATRFAESLAAHGQIEGAALKRAPRAATHAIETDAEGRRRLVRKRFSAF